MVKTYKDVFIEFDNHNQLSDYIDEITKNVLFPWKRNFEREKDGSAFAKEPFFCFEREVDELNLACGLTIFFKDQKKLYIPNIVPIESGQFTVDQYNSLLSEFYNNYLVVYAVKHNIQTSITNDVLSDEEILGSNTASCLRRFSNLANKSTGSCHPRDRERWYEFIKCAFDSSRIKTINSELLQQVLNEQGWSEDRAVDLVIEYEFGLGLLEYLNE
ncbi:hypothetical protein ACG9XW_16815 [Acinetobacter guillouiae]|uniref:hypothetical protein n=1 Tax=Acinetobacter guillouiae TaxID=106649 RepID=UPI003AF61E5F